MSGKSKASDRTNLGTGAAPINWQYNPVKLKFTILFFQNSRFMKVIRHQIPVIPDPSPVKMAFKTVIRSIVWLTAVQKFLSFIFQNNRVFFASAFLSVQFKSNTEYSVYSMFQSIPYIPYLTILHVFRHSAEQGHPNIGEDIIKKDRRPVGFLNR